MSERFYTQQAEYLKKAKKSSSKDVSIKNIQEFIPNITYNDFKSVTVSTLMHLEFAIKEYFSEV